MSEINVDCPYCKAGFVAKEEWIGLKTKCLKCSKEFIIANKKSSSDLISDETNKQMENITKCQNELYKKQRIKRWNNFEDNFTLGLLSIIIWTSTALGLASIFGICYIVLVIKENPIIVIYLLIMSMISSAVFSFLKGIYKHVKSIAEKDN